MKPSSCRDRLANLVVTPQIEGGGEQVMLKEQWSKLVKKVHYDKLIKVLQTVGGRNNPVNHVVRLSSYFKNLVCNSVAGAARGAAPFLVGAGEPPRSLAASGGGG